MPARVIDLEMTDAPAALGHISSRYDWVRVLVRLHGRPVGYLDLANEAGELEPNALHARAAREHCWRIWNAMLASRWQAPSQTETAELPPISVVVLCTRTTAAMLEDCLAALSKQRRLPQEVIVVDNGPRESVEQPQKVARRFAAGYVRETAIGSGRARNRGLAEATAPLIAYVDADTRPDSGWLEALSEAFVAPEVAAVTGLVVADALETDPQILFDGERTGGTSFDLQTHARRGFANTYYPQLCGAQCNMAFRRESLNRLGGFDPALDFGSEASGSAVDVFQRLLESDAVIVYEPHVLVRQQQPRTWGAVERRLFDEARARSIVLWAAMRRARGRERFRVFAAYSRWFFHTWRRLLRRVVRRGERMPVKFLLLELAAGPAGMVAYSRGRRREQARS